MTEQTQAKAPHNLDLSALPPERDTATIRTEAEPDGRQYELADPADFSAGGLQDIGRLVREMDTLWESDAALKPAKQKRLDKILDILAGKLIVDIEPEVVEALPAVTKRMLALRFFISGGLTMAEGLGEAATYLSGSSSDDSNGSTGETP